MAIFSGCGGAAAATGVTALDTPAIAVRAPANVVLIAVANAGSRLVAVGEHGVITFSDDDGRDWKQAQVPVDVTLTDVKFATPTDGWATGHYGVILHTTDGGAIWKVQLTGLEANQLTMAAAQAAVAGKSTAAGAPLAVVRATHFIADGADKPFLSILAKNDLDVMVFGAYRMTMKTTDGGKDWVDWSLHIMDPLSHNLYDSAVVGSSDCVVGEAGLVFCSDDGGANFASVASPTNTTLFGVLATDEGRMFVYGVAGTAFRTDDDARSWQPVDFGTQANLTAGLVLKSGAIVVASEAGAIYASFDGAKTFAEQPDGQSMEIYGLAQAADGDIIAVGDQGAKVIPLQTLTNH
jgi:photosystem II stability/assembly factor-like uncharacterized protein